MASPKSHILINFESLSSINSYISYGEKKKKHGRETCLVVDS